jgi:hypothetical protein
MSQEIKLTPQEIEELKSIQLTYQEKTFQFGQLYIDKLNLTEKQKEIELAESKLKQELLDNQKKEKSWMDNISIKYGEGSLNLSTGTFIPAP